VPHAPTSDVRIVAPLVLPLVLHAATDRLHMGAPMKPAVSMRHPDSGHRGQREPKLRAHGEPTTMPRRRR
jgi:hypothetical protein